MGAVGQAREQPAGRVPSAKDPANPIPNPSPWGGLTEK